MSKMDNVEQVSTFLIPSLTKGIVANKVLVETLKTAHDLLAGHQKRYQKFHLISTVLGVTSATTSAALIFTYRVTNTNHFSHVLLLSAIGGLAGIGSALLSYRNLIQSYKMTKIIEPEIQNCLHIFDRDNVHLRDELDKVPQVMRDLEDIGYDLGQLTTMTAPLTLGTTMRNYDDTNIDQIKVAKVDCEKKVQDDLNSTSCSEYKTLVNNEDYIWTMMEDSLPSTGTLIGGLCTVPYAKIGLMMRDYYDMVMTLSYTQLTMAESLFWWTRRGVLVGVVAVAYGNINVAQDLKKVHPLLPLITQFISVLEEDAKDKQNFLCLLRLWHQVQING